MSFPGRAYRYAARRSREFLNWKHSFSDLKNLKLSGFRTFFSLGVHPALVADAQDLWSDLDIDVVDWSLSYHAALFGKATLGVPGLSNGRWLEIDDRKVEKFVSKHREVLKRFDGFLVSYPPAFVRLFQEFDKPVICLVGTRYEHPFTLRPAEWRHLDETLLNGVNSGWLTVVSNNRADRDYMHFYVGLEPHYIPSICSYVDAPFEFRSNPVILGQRNFDRSVGLPNLSDDLLIERSEAFPAWVTWQQMHTGSGWVHVPYNVSQMSFFEQYYSGVPMIFPSDSWLESRWSQFTPGVMSEVSFFQIHGKPPSSDPPDGPNNISSPTVRKWWLERADFAEDGELQQVHYFSDVKELETLLVRAKEGGLAGPSKEVNLRRREAALERWRELL